MLNDRCSTSTFSALAFDRVLAAQLPPGASLAAARFDFALLALLRGNDYLPRMRGVKCETRSFRLWSLGFIADVIDLWQSQRRLDAVLRDAWQQEAGKSDLQRRVARSSSSH